MICPFCKSDPYEYVHNGVGFTRVGVTCCRLGVDLFQRETKGAIRVLKLLRSHSPRRKARAMKIMRQCGSRPERQCRHTPVENRYMDDCSDDPDFWADIEMI